MTRPKTNMNGRILNLKRSNNCRGKTALIRTHENEIDCSFAEIDRENLYLFKCCFNLSTTHKRVGSRESASKYYLHYEIATVVVLLMWEHLFLNRLKNGRSLKKIYENVLRIAEKMCRKMRTANIGEAQLV